MAGSTIWAPVGDKGPDGDPGPQGPPGEQGPQGGPGPDAGTFLAFVNSLANKTNPLEGTALVGRQPINFNSVTELRATPGRFDGDRCKLTGYNLGDRYGYGRGGTWVLGDSTPDDNGMYFAATGGVWIMDLDTNGEVNGQFYGLPFANGVDCFARINQMYLYCKANTKVMVLKGGPLGIGRYDTKDMSQPMTGARDPGQPFTTMGFGIKSSPMVVFETNPVVNGADVFNICSTDDFFITGFPRITGTLPVGATSGSNGVSIIFGGTNLLFEVRPNNMPKIDTNEGGEPGTNGGHGVTIQFGTGNTNPCDQITFRGKSYRCTSGINIDFSPTNTITYPNCDILIDNYVAEECYRGFTAGGTAPTSSTLDPNAVQPIINIHGTMYIKNCQQGIINERTWGNNLNFNLVNTKDKADLIRHTYDLATFGGRFLGCKFGSCKVVGRVQTLDKLWILGGTGMGGNSYAAIERFKLELNVTHGVVTAEVEVLNPTSVPLQDSIVELFNVTTGYQDLVNSSQNSTVSLNGAAFVPSLEAGDNTVQAPGGPISRVYYDVPITANKFVNAPVTYKTGDVIEVIRTDACTGAFNINLVSAVGLATPGTWAAAEWNGTAWRRIKSGTV